MTLGVAFLWEALSGLGAVIAIVSVAIAAFYASRAKAQADARDALIENAQGNAVAWKGERDAAVDKTDRLESALKYEREQRALVDIELAKCLERTDLRPVVDMLRELEEEWGRQHKDLSTQVTGQFTQIATLLTTLTTVVTERLDVAARVVKEGKS